MNRLIVPGLLISLASFHTSADEVPTGKQLVDENCYRCHGTAVYTRPNRRVTSLEGLHKQVRLCQKSLGLTWFDEDIANVASYLNEQFYKFKP